MALGWLTPAGLHTSSAALPIEGRLPPLDGAAVLSGFLPDALQFIPRTLQRYGTILFFVLFLSGFLGIVMRPAYHLVQLWADTLQRIAASEVAP